MVIQLFNIGVLNISTLGGVKIIIVRKIIIFSIIQFSEFGHGQYCMHTITFASDPGRTPGLRLTLRLGNSRAAARASLPRSPLK